jgi:hypothetical protein
METLSSYLIAGGYDSSVLTPRNVVSAGTRRPQIGYDPSWRNEQSFCDMEHKAASISTAGYCAMLKSKV